MKDIDELKRKWREIDIPAPNASIGDGNIRRTIPHSIKDRICRMNRRMLLVGTGGLLVVPSLEKAFDAPLWFMIFYGCYFLLAIAFNLIQLRMLRKTDLSTLTTVEAIAFLKRFSTTRSRFRTIMICLAVPLLVSLLCLIYHKNEPTMLLAAIVGGMMGALLGLRINNRFKKNIAMMRKFLGEE